MKIREGSTNLIKAMKPTKSNSEKKFQTNLI